MRPRHATLPALAVAGLAAYDLLQKKHAILRTFPILGHARYALEEIGPELRQYIVTNNNDERPFSRDQRTWVYASSKLENNYFGFGTDNDIEDNAGDAIVKHRTFADVPAPAPGGHHADLSLPSAKVLGGPRGRRRAFRPESAVNVSAMSYGSLSGPAIRALNLGARRAGCLHNTGEGGLSDHHRQGGDLVFQVGTGYFGCRDAEGRFSLDALLATIADAPVRALEVKLSQGAKPGLGGFLPAAKVTPEIARIRGIPQGQDCISPSRHAAFDDVDSMLDFVEALADATGLPVGIKSAVGDLSFWDALAGAMAADPGRGVDFITIDGGEGGTGAAPLVFSDAVAFPLRVGFARAYSAFARAGIAQDVTWIASGKCGLPDNAVVLFALGADMVNVAREAMMAIGCIQSQRCHTGRCPTGIATQNPWLARGVDPASKAERLANYVRTLRRELVRVSEAVGVVHPGLVTGEDIELMDRTTGARRLAEVFGYEPGWGLPGEADVAAITALMRGQERVVVSPEVVAQEVGVTR